MVVLASLTSITLISVVSFLCALLTTKSTRILEAKPILMGLAVGCLLGEAFIHAVPEAFQLWSGNTTKPTSLILVGILFFFLLEKISHWHHPHAQSEESSVPAKSITVLAGTLIHNILDGMLAAATFKVNGALGLITVTAIILHEIPHEIAMFGVILGMGMNVRKALLGNILTALGGFLGVGIALLLNSEVLSAILIPLGAGSFIYIAASDLIPELHQEKGVKSSLRQFGGIVAGIFLMLALSFVR